MIFELPLVTPLRFFQQTDLTGILTTSDIDLSGFNPNYNSRGFDADFFARRLQEWQSQDIYIQPFQRGDIVPIYWKHDRSIIDYTLNVLDETGSIVLTDNAFTAVTSGALTGAYYELPMYELANGIYFAQLQYNNSGEDVFFISEPFEVANTHEGTLLLEYRNSYNDQNVFFEEFDFDFRLRVHGSLTELNPKVNVETYEDQTLNQTLLSAKPYREYVAIFGGDSHPIPEWKADKIMRVFSCDDVTVDGDAYVVSSDANIEPNRAKDFALGEWSMTLRDAINKDSVELNYYEAFDYHMGQAPISDRFYIGRVITTSSSYSVDREIVGLNNLCSWLSTFINSTGSITGEVVINSQNEIIYKYDNVTSHNWINSETPTLSGVLHNWLCLEVDTDVAVAPTLDFQSLNFDAVIWGDGTKRLYGTAGGTHTYTAQGVVKCHYYFNDETTLTPATTAGTPAIISLDGQVINNLVQLVVENEPLKKVGNRLLLQGDSSLNNLSFQGCELSVSQVNTIIIMILDSVTNKKIASSGTALLDLMTPSAPPTNTGSMGSVLALTKNLWTIDHD